MHTQTPISVLGLDPTDINYNWTAGKRIAESIYLLCIFSKIYGTMHLLFLFLLLCVYIKNTIFFLLKLKALIKEIFHFWIQNDNHINLGLKRVPCLCSVKYQDLVCNTWYLKTTSNILSKNLKRGNNNWHGILG